MIILYHNGDYENYDEYVECSEEQLQEMRLLVTTLRGAQIYGSIVGRIEVEPGAVGVMFYDQWKVKHTEELQQALKRLEEQAKEKARWNAMSAAEKREWAKTHHATSIPLEADCCDGDDCQ